MISFFFMIFSSNLNLFNFKIEMLLKIIIIFMMLMMTWQIMKMMKFNMNFFNFFMILFMLTILMFFSLLMMYNLIKFFNLKGGDKDWKIIIIIIYYMLLNWHVNSMIKLEMNFLKFFLIFLLLMILMLLSLFVTFNFIELFKLKINSEWEVVSIIIIYYMLMNWQINKMIELDMNFCKFFMILFSLTILMFFSLFMIFNFIKFFNLEVKEKWEVIVMMAYYTLMNWHINMMIKLKMNFYKFFMTLLLLVILTFFSLIMIFNFNKFFLLEIKVEFGGIIIIIYYMLLNWQINKMIKLEMNLYKFFMILFSLTILMFISLIMILNLNELFNLKVYSKWSVITVIVFYMLLYWQINMMIKLEMDFFKFFMTLFLLTILMFIYLFMIFNFNKFFNLKIDEMWGVTIMITYYMFMNWQINSLIKLEMNFYMFFMTLILLMILTFFSLIMILNFNNFLNSKIDEEWSLIIIIYYTLMDWQIDVYIELETNFFKFFMILFLLVISIFVILFVMFYFFK